MKEIDSIERTKTRNKVLWTLMKDSKWRTLKEINESTGWPSASASACLRDFRKPQYGSNIVDKKYLGQGIYQYKLTVINEMIV